MLEPHQDKAIRRAAVAGLFYPADPGELKSAVEELLANSKIKHRPGRIRALIVPHAGYVYSGPVAAKAFALLRTAHYYAGRAAIIGPAHKIWIRGIAVPSVRAFATPLGKIPLDTTVIEEIAALPSAAIDDKPHANEHALEVELPFLQTVLGSARIVPLLVGSATPTEVAEVLSRLWDDDTLIVVSSDLSHFLRYEDAQRRDSATADSIERLDETAIDFEDACGAIPVRGLLRGEASWPFDRAPRFTELRRHGGRSGPGRRLRGLGYSRRIVHVGIRKAPISMLGSRLSPLG
jgi:MEMO1 family protein